METNAPNNEMASDGWAQNMASFNEFLTNNPSIQYLRLEWLDFNSNSRTRIMHMTTALEMFTRKKMVEVTPVATYLLSNDQCAPGGGATGLSHLYPDFTSLRCAARAGYATVNCEIRDGDGNEIPTCPRTLFRKIQAKAKNESLNILIGFEIEVIFMEYSVTDSQIHYSRPLRDTQGHIYGSVRALHSPRILSLVESIIQSLTSSGISLQQWHPEGAPGQWEFVLPPHPPLQAIDTLLSAREIIASCAATHSLRATLLPKPYPDYFVGSGAHLHISLNPPDEYSSFYAGILKHLRAITAFTLPSPASYERATDFAYSGGTWVSWGTQNRETPLRKIDGSSHWEIKCVDGLANIYLALAAIIGCGLKGIEDGEILQLKDCVSDPARLSSEERKAVGITEKIPGSVGEALSSLEGDEVVKEEVMGREMVDAYVSVKKGEVEIWEGMEEGTRRDYLIERY